MHKNIRITIPAIPPYNLITINMGNNLLSCICCYLRFLSGRQIIPPKIGLTKTFSISNPRDLIAINNENAEQALELTTKVMAKIVLLGDKAESDEVFSTREIFYLFDIDFFTLESSDKKHWEETS